MKNKKLFETADSWYRQFDIVGTVFDGNSNTGYKRNSLSYQTITVCDILDPVKPLQRYSQEEYASSNKSMLLVSFGFNEDMILQNEHASVIPCKVLLDLCNNMPIEKSDYYKIIRDILNIDYQKIMNHPSKMAVSPLARNNNFLYSAINLIKESIDMIFTSGMIYDLMLEVQVNPIYCEMFSKGFRIDTKGMKCEYEMIRNENEILRIHLNDNFRINPDDQETLSVTSDESVRIILDRYLKNKMILSRYKESRLIRKEKNQGLVTCSYNQIGTKTLRVSTYDVNVYGMPKRLCQHFKPAEGNIFIEGDYHASQLIIIANLAGEEWIITAYEQGEDIYKLFGAYFFVKKTSMVRDNERKAMKKLFFAQLNGAGERRLKSILCDNGVMIDGEGMKRGMSLLLDKIPNIDKYLKSLKYKQNMVTPSGRYWGEEDLPEYRKRASYIIQTIESEILFSAVIEIDHDVSNYEGMRLHLTKHDSITIETPIKYAAQAEIILKNNMTSAFQRYFLSQMKVFIATSRKANNERKITNMKKNIKENPNFDVNTVGNVLSRYKALKSKGKNVPIVRFEEDVHYLAIVSDYSYDEKSDKVSITFDIIIEDKTRKHTEKFKLDTAAYNYYAAMMDTLTDGDESADIIGQLCYVTFHMNEGFTNIEVVNITTEEEVGIQTDTGKEVKEQKSETRYAKAMRARKEKLFAEEDDSEEADDFESDNGDQDCFWDEEDED